MGAACESGVNATQLGNSRACRGCLSFLVFRVCFGHHLEMSSKAYAEAGSLPGGTVRGSCS